MVIGPIDTVLEKKRGIALADCEKDCIWSASFQLLFLPFLYALGSKPTNFMSTFILFENPDIHDQFISPPKFKDFKNKEDN